MGQEPTLTRRSFTAGSATSTGSSAGVRGLAAAGTLDVVQLNMGVNGLDFGCRIRRSGPRIAGMISKTMPSKPTSADSNQRAFALAA